MAYEYDLIDQSYGSELGFNLHAEHPGCRVLQGSVSELA
jgi:hypothetical protein